MEQTQIYEYIGVDHDPVFSKISRLQRGQAVNLGNMVISLNNAGLYELESTDYHECFMSKKQLYEGVSKFFSLVEFNFSGGMNNG